MRIFRDIFSGVTLAGVLALVLIMVSFAWTNPTEVPPGGSGALTAKTVGGIQKVGIGEQNPQYKLDVVAGTDSKGFRSTGIAAIMGQLGIGTESPKEKLHISDGSILQNKPVTPIVRAGTSHNWADVPTRGVRVAVSGKYAYVTFYHSDNDAFRIIDVSNPIDPQVIGGKFITDFPIGRKALDVAVSGRYAYLTFDGVGQNAFRVVDVSNPSDPKVVGGANLISRMPSVNPVTLYASGKYIYMTFNGKGNQSFRIIDVSDPVNPRVVGGDVGITDSDIPASANYGIAVFGKYAYMNIDCQILGCSSGENSFRAIDISVPEMPKVVGGKLTRFVNVPNAPPVDIYISGRYAYVSFFASGTDAFRVIDISDPINPKIAGSLTPGVGLPSGKAISVAGAGKYAYLGYEGSQENAFRIIDISNPKNPEAVGGNIAGIDISGLNFGLDVGGRFVYISSDNQFDNRGVFRIIDVTGLEAVSGSIQSLEVGSLQVRENTSINNDLNIRGGLNVGSTILSAGGAAIGGDLFLKDKSSSGGIKFSTGLSDPLFPAAESCNEFCGSKSVCIAAFLDPSGDKVACDGNPTSKKRCLCAGFGS